MILHQVKKTIRKTFGNLPIEDSPVSLPLMILPEDIHTAVQKDSERCVLANAAMRSFGAKTVLFFLTSAYVELPNRKGGKTVFRFMVPKTVRETIENFDRGTSPVAGQMVTLLPPTGSNTLDAQCKKADTFREKYRAALLRGELRPAGFTPTVMPDVRNGRGRVSMKVKQTKTN